MKETLQVLNELEQSGIISRYAIGGAVGAIFYMEPFLTYDLDVFVLLPRTTDPLITLAPIYNTLRDRGYAEEAEYISIAGIPVQFLPAYDALIEEALSSSMDISYAGTPTRILRAEYLIAIMLQTGRDKDRQRFVAFVRQAKFDETKLLDILQRHKLRARYLEWKGIRQS